MRIIAQHRRARFDYDITDTWTAGIILTGQEVKACKIDHCNISNAAITLNHNEKTLQIINMDIPLYSKTSPSSAPGYQAKKSRTLLLNKRELTRIASKLSQGGGAALIPLQLIEVSNRRIKLEFGIGKRRRKVEKRHIIRERDTTRQMQQEMKDY